MRLFVVLDGDDLGGCGRDIRHVHPAAADHVSTYEPKPPRAMAGPSLRFRVDNGLILALRSRLCVMHKTSSGTQER